MWVMVTQGLVSLLSGEHYLLNHLLAPFSFFKTGFAVLPIVKPPGYLCLSPELCAALSFRELLSAVATINAETQNCPRAEGK